MVRDNLVHDNGYVGGNAGYGLVVEATGTTEGLKTAIDCTRPRGHLVLNTGSFTFPGRPHVVKVQGDEVSLAPLVRRGGEWRQDAAARRCWRISEVARESASASTPVS